MPPPSVTVAISAYRHNESLRRTLESVAAQGYEGPVDALVVDSSETGMAADVVENFRFATHCWQLEYVPRRETGLENLAVGRELGIRFADGDFVHLLDRGDELEPTALERKVRALQSHDRAGAAYSTVRKADGSVGNIPPPVRGNELRFVLTYHRTPALPSTLMVSRDVLLDCPPRPQLPHEDLCGLIEILLRTDIGYIDRPLTVRTDPPDMARSVASRRGILRTYDRYAGLREQFLSETHMEIADAQIEEVRSAFRRETGDETGEGE